jgi:two-component system, response regulator YesN
VISIIPADHNLENLTVDIENLYTILVVDDEEPFRKGFNYIINWKSLGFRIASEASNAIEALDLLENRKYDVLVTDINMPGKSGIEFIEYVRQNNSDLKIFIVSGYNRFDYAVSAIKLDVEDYILKPINKDQVVNRFLKLKEDLDRKRVSKMRINIGDRMARSHFFEHLVQDDYSSKEKVLSLINKLEIYVPDRGMNIVIAKFDDLNRFIDRNFNGNDEYFENTIFEYNKVVSNNSSHPAPILTTYINNNYVFMITDHDCACFIEALAMCLDKLGADYHIGVGNSVDDLGYISVSYQQAIESLQKYPDKRITYYTQSGIDISGRTSSLIMLQKKIIDTMEAGRYQEIYQLVDSIFSVLEGSIINFIYNWSINSIHDIIDYFELDKLNAVKITYNFHFMGADENQIFSLVKKSYLTHLEKIVDALKGFSSKPNQDLIKKACDIIEHKYALKEFSMDDVANELHISYSYLCTVFKQITGENFSDYLTAVRMKNARKIIIEGGHKIFEIANMVGYNTSRYFTLVFKKYYGVSPSGYKERLGGSKQD